MFDFICAQVREAKKIQSQAYSTLMEARQKVQSKELGKNKIPSSFFISEVALCRKAHFFETPFQTNAILKEHVINLSKIGAVFMSSTIVVIYAFCCKKPRVAL